MNSKMIFSGLGILAVAVAVVAIWLSQEKESASEIGASQSAIKNCESAVHRMALESPEEFQTRTVVKREAPKPLTVPSERPKQLSEIEKSAIGPKRSADNFPQGNSDEGAVHHRSTMQKEPVPVESLYFHKDYESMRKDEIRNPDSKENRAGVVALMKMRQRRASSESTK